MERLGKNQTRGTYICIFPVNEVHFTFYLQHVAVVTQSKSAAEEAVHCISRAHQIAGLKSIASCPIVRVILKGLQRELAKHG